MNYYVYYKLNAAQATVVIKILSCIARIEREFGRGRFGKGTVAAVLLPAVVMTAVYLVFQENPKSEIRNPKQLRNPNRAE